MIALDTHILIWDALAPARLSAAAADAIRRATVAEGLLIADITLWEIAMLIQKGRVQVQADTHSFLNLLLSANRLIVQPITPQIAALSTQLPPAVTTDPADRLILATALAVGIPLVTADSNLRDAAIVPTIW